MGLGDVANKNLPEDDVSSRRRGTAAACATRSFIPHVCHDAIGVLAAVTVGTACVLDGSVCGGVATLPTGRVKKVSVEHPTGEFSVLLEVDPANPQNVTRAGAAAHRPAQHARRSDHPRFGVERKPTVIIDCHGHYTTAPKALDNWRNQQIAGIKDPAVIPKVSDLKISDDEIARDDRDQPAQAHERARQRSHHLQSASEFHGAPHRRLQCVIDLGGDMQRTLLPR